jgi:membrane-associated phospholipid phosphatase
MFYSSTEHLSIVLDLTMTSFRLSLLLAHILSPLITVAAFQPLKFVSVRQFGVVQAESTGSLMPAYRPTSSKTARTMVSDAKKEEPSLTDSILFAIGGTTSIFVAGTFFIILAYQRDAFMVSFFIGSILNGVLSKILKKAFNQDRPMTVGVSTEQPSDKGMPSSHAMSLGFIGTFTALALDWTLVPIVLYGATSLYYRVQTKLHTKEQVAVGLIVGIFNGVLWRTLVDGSNPLVPQVNIMELVSQHFLDSSGVLPIPYLAVPAIVGALVVGSFERKISKWIKKLKSK